MVRHAQTIWNASGRIQGQADPVLSAAGREQCDRVSRRLARAGLDAIFTSDLVRAKETAEAIALPHAGLEVKVEPGLREVDLGEWEGADRDSLQQRWPDLFQRWLTAPSWDLVPGGEGAAPFKARVMDTFGRLVAGTGAGSTIVAVTHIGVIRTLLSVLVGIPSGTLPFLWSVDNTGITVLQKPISASAWQSPATEVTAINDNLHLNEAWQAA